jgi:hypothetical protein
VHHSSSTVSVELWKKNMEFIVTEWDMEFVTLNARVWVRKGIREERLEYVDPGSRAALYVLLVIFLTSSFSCMPCALRTGAWNLKSNNFWCF